MGIVVLGLEIVRRFLQRTGPYLLVVLLPGGSVLALLIFLYRRRRPGGLNEKLGDRRQITPDDGRRQLSGTGCLIREFSRTNQMKPPLQ